MSTADDLRDLRDALDSIAHGALPRWGKPTTKTGEEAQRAAVEVYGKWIRALHFESAAKASVEKSLAAEDQHRTHSEILTDRIEKLEAENARMRERMSDQEDGLRYGEKVCATLVSERDAARSQVKAWQAEELARRAERDEVRAEVERLRGDLARCREVQAATAEGWRHEVAEIAKIIGEDPHTAYLADAVRRVVEERDGLKWELDMAQKFHDVAVKERDYLRVCLARLEREETAK